MHFFFSSNRFEKVQTPLRYPSAYLIDRRVEIMSREDAGVWTSELFCQDKKTILLPGSNLAKKMKICKQVRGLQPAVGVGGWGGGGAMTDASKGISHHLRTRNQTYDLLCCQATVEMTFHTVTSTQPNKTTWWTL